MRYPAKAAAGKDLPGYAKAAPGETLIMSGNEACIRGALEAGLQFAAAYPGSPTSEILTNLAMLSGEFGHYAEWSSNEKVSMEVAAAASFAGLRSLCIMKSVGLNVVSDFLGSLSLSGCKGGLVMLVADDPASHSSINEQDTRLFSKMFEIPMIEPGDYQDAKDMLVWAFELSEAIGQVVMVRAVTRICHGRGNVVAGEIKDRRRQARFARGDRFICSASNHKRLHQQLAQAAQYFENCPFNEYTGPADAENLIILSGTAWMYAQDAIESLDVAGQAGVLKLATTHPLPEKLVLSHLISARRVLILEEVSDFLEESVLALAARHLNKLRNPKFLGQRSGDVAGPQGPGIGEMDVDRAERAIKRLLGIQEENLTFGLSLPAVGLAASSDAGLQPPVRDLALCSGCPHRASFWAVKTALEMDGRDGFVTGDIGCYCMGTGRTGYYLLRTLHCMGAGPGLAGGFGQLGRFGFDQPVVSIVGDSTFFHAAIPALINAQYNQSNFLLIVLDNGTTAMTGHQPHPGAGKSAAGLPAPKMAIEDLCRGLGIPAQVCDPFDVEGTVQTIYDSLQEEAVKVIVMRQPCALEVASTRKGDKVWVDQDACRGDECGCNKFCTRVWACPANIWDDKAGKATIDEVICNKCGVCVDLCPSGAIKIAKSLKAVV